MPPRSHDVADKAGDLKRASVTASAIAEALCKSMEVRKARWSLQCCTVMFQTFRRVVFAPRQIARLN